MSTTSTTLTVRVQPKASRNACSVDESGRVRIALTAPPVDGAANEALIEFVADRLDVAKRCVRLVSGEKSRDKTIAIDGLNIESVLRRFRARK
jgi:hypothetical protein